MRIRSGLPSLRRRREYAALRAALAAGSDRFGFRVVHFSVQTNHLHMICEAKDRRVLARGTAGLTIRIARALNRLWARTGKVFGDRYHDRILRTPREVRNALRYVLENARRHGVRVVGIDPCSSGKWFEGWKGLGPRWTSSAVPVARARTWLLTHGWRRHGLLPLPGA